MSVCRLHFSSGLHKDSEQKWQHHFYWQFMSPHATMTAFKLPSCSQSPLLFRLAAFPGLMAAVALAQLHAVNIDSIEMLFLLLFV